MYHFSVADMSCDHCASTITKALQDEDPQARVDISLAEHLVRVETGLSREKIAQCIGQAGYTPETVAG